MPLPMGFAEDENVGMEIPFAGAAAGAGADGVGFVGDQQRAVAASEFAGGGPVAVVGENDADVGHGGLGEDAGDVVMLESVFEGCRSLNSTTRVVSAGFTGGPMLPRRGPTAPFSKRGERFVYRAVIAVMEDEDFGALGDFAGDANGETVGVGGGERELPVGQAETALEIFADPERVFGGKHEGDAFADAAGDGFGDDLGRVAGHGAGVAEAEVDVVAAVDVGEMRAAGGFYEDGEGAGPFVHPVHGDAAEERGLGAEIEFGGAGMVGDEALFFALVEDWSFARSMWIMGIACKLADSLQPPFDSIPHYIAISSFYWKVAHPGCGQFVVFLGIAPYCQDPHELFPSSGRGMDKNREFARH